VRLTNENVNAISALVYTAVSLLVAAAFFGATLAGDYGWVARLGGTAWVFMLAMVVLMPTVPGILAARVSQKG
jgi:hypothetical protein